MRAEKLNDPIMYSSKEWARVDEMELAEADDLFGLFWLHNDDWVIGGHLPVAFQRCWQRWHSFTRRRERTNDEA